LSDYLTTFRRVGIWYYYYRNGMGIVLIGLSTTAWKRSFITPLKIAIYDCDCTKVLVDGRLGEFRGLSPKVGRHVFRYGTK